MSHSEEQRTVGVGPWASERPDQPRPTGVRYDSQLLDDGDTRNVPDAYRYWTVEAIVAELDKTRHPLHVAIENWQHDFNIGSIVRTANAMNVAGVHIVGKRRWNKRGAMVTDRYLHVHHHPDIDELRSWVDSHQMPLFGLENSTRSVPIETYDLPERMMLLLGQEGPGLSEATQEACDGVLSVAQFGSTRSLNAGAAAAIAMHAWVRRHAFGQLPGADQQ